MMKFLVVLIIAFGAWHWYSQKPPGFTGDAHERVVMYSLTTCGYCDRKRQDLTAARIPFVEHFIDRDPSRQDELTRKLQRAGIPPQQVGTPSFDVFGHMLINNPSLDKIRAHMVPAKKTS